jgi:hypothetical protein
MVNPLNGGTNNFFEVGDAVRFSPSVYIDEDGRDLDALGVAAGQVIKNVTTGQRTFVQSIATIDYGGGESNNAAVLTGSITITAGDEIAFYTYGAFTTDQNATESAFIAPQIEEDQGLPKIANATMIFGGKYNTIDLTSTGFVLAAVSGEASANISATEMANFAGRVAVYFRAGLTNTATSQVIMMMGSGDDDAGPRALRMIYDQDTGLYGWLYNGIAGRAPYQITGGAAPPDARGIYPGNDSRLVFPYGYIYGDLDGPHVSYGAAAPGAGTWKKADRIWNTDPGVGAGEMGWVCTAAGTPGTWKAFGTVEA